MSDTVKLIIEISKDYYEIIKHEVDHHLSDYRPFEIIANGIPLDSVIEEERKKYNDIALDLLGEVEDYEKAIEDIKAEMKELKGTFPTSKYIAIINKHMKGDNK